jgi:hypothetical protein
LTSVAHGRVKRDVGRESVQAQRSDPKGLGFAAVRDFNSFLRFASVDDFGTPNPLAGDINRIYTEISSQRGRLLNDLCISASTRTSADARSSTGCCNGSQPATATT